ncbi:SAM-dependent methyltransferase [Paenibacillus hamazuiensis]|uniref:SAM-dependent methyltransferase n=1 Tax=Paenibacillus hamazuiensis TaxID=2936508 RepID=UPI0020101660|nr:class I SAM-dependent methyltransferase [Paenibacillus hamazuiensis]
MRINNKNFIDFEFDGEFYKEVGDFIRENYFNYGFTKGTVQEVDFLVELLDLPPDSRILDIGCGPGRHSLELARRGFTSVGIDISPEFVKYAAKAASAEKLSAEFHTMDARELKFSEEFDGAICLCEGAFGLAGNLDNHRKVLRGVQNALKPGAPFVLTAINALSAARNNNDPENFDAYSSTSFNLSTIKSPEGEMKEVAIYTTGFTFRELKLLFEESGFEVLAGYGCVAGKFSRKPLELDDVEIMMVARRK